MMLGCERVKEVSFLCEKLLPSECTNEKGIISCCKHWTDNPTCQFGPHVPYLRRKKRRNVPPRYVCHVLLDDVSDNAVCDNVVCVWHVSMLCVCDMRQCCVCDSGVTMWCGTTWCVTLQHAVCDRNVCVCDNALHVWQCFGCDSAVWHNAVCVWQGCVHDRATRGKFGVWKCCACVTMLRVTICVCGNVAYVAML